MPLFDIIVLIIRKLRFYAGLECGGRNKNRYINGVSLMAAIDFLPTIKKIHIKQQ